MRFNLSLFAVAVGAAVIGCADSFAPRTAFSGGLEFSADVSWSGGQPTARLHVRNPGAEPVTVRVPISPCEPELRLYTRHWHRIDWQPAYGCPDIYLARTIEAGEKVVLGSRSLADAPRGHVHVILVGGNPDYEVFAGDVVLR